MSESKMLHITASGELKHKRPGPILTVFCITASLLYLVIVMAGCSTVVHEGKEVEIARDQYKQFWPLTVESATLACVNPTGRRQGEAVLRTADGITYFLNDTAKSAGHADLNPITLDHPSAPGVKMNTLRFTELAVDQCH